MKVLFLAVALIVLLAGSAMAWDTPSALWGYHILERDSGNYFSHIQASWVSGSLFANPAATVLLDTTNPTRTGSNPYTPGAAAIDWTVWTNGASITLDTPNTAAYKSIYEDWFFVGAYQNTVFDMSVWSGNTCLNAQRITVGYNVLDSVNLVPSQQTRFDAAAVPEPGTIMAAMALLAPAGMMFRRRSA